MYKIKMSERNGEESIIDQDDSLELIKGRYNILRKVLFLTDQEESIHLRIENDKGETIHI